MARFERIVRPFETRDVSPPRRVHSSYHTEPENVEMEFGKNGSGKSMSGSINMTVTKYMDQTHKEKPRT